MQLCYNNTFSTINDKGTILGHVRDSSEEHILNYRTEILMVGVGAVKLHLRLQGNTICKTSLQTLVNGVAWRVNIVVEELKNEIIAGISNREVLREHLIQSVILAFFGWSIQLKEVLERLQLHIEEIRIRIRIMNAGKIYSVINNLCSHK